MSDLSQIKSEESGTEAESNQTYIQLNPVYESGMPNGQNFSILESSSHPSHSKIYMYHTGITNTCIVHPLLGSKQVLVETGPIQMVCDPNTLYTIDQSDPDNPKIIQSQPSSMPVIEANVANSEQIHIENDVKIEGVSYIEEDEVKPDNILNIVNDNGEPVRFFNMNDVEYNENSEQSESLHSTQDNITLEHLNMELKPRYVENNVDDPPSDDNITLENLSMELRPRYVGNNVDDPPSDVEISDTSYESDDPPYRAKPEDSEAGSDSDSDFELSRYAVKKIKKEAGVENETVEHNIKLCKCPDILAINHLNDEKLKLQCTMCTTQYDCQFHFNAHKDAHSFPFECEVCFNRFPLAINEDIHYRYKHCPKQARFVCRLCLIDLKTEKSYNLHYPLCCKHNSSTSRVVIINQIEGNKRKNEPIVEGINSSYKKTTKRKKKS